MRKEKSGKVCAREATIERKTWRSSQSRIVHRAVRLAGLASLFAVMILLNLATATAFVQSHNLSEIRNIDKNLAMGSFAIQAANLNLTGFANCNLETNALGQVTCGFDDYVDGDSSAANELQTLGTSGSLPNVAVTLTSGGSVLCSALTGSTALCDGSDQDTDTNCNGVSCSLRDNNVNCNSVDTDASGYLVCGTDEVNDADSSSTNEIQNLQSVTNQGSTTSSTITLRSGVEIPNAALYVNAAEAIWFDGTYFSWGFGGARNYFADPIGIYDSNPLADFSINKAWVTTDLDLMHVWRWDNNGWGFGVAPGEFKMYAAPDADIVWGSRSNAASPVWTEKMRLDLANAQLSLNSASTDTYGSQMYVYRTSGAAPGRAAIHAYRATNGGGNRWSYPNVDAAIVGSSYWGNLYSAGIAANSYLDYSGSAALSASQYNDGGGGTYTSLALLGARYLDGNVYAGYFEGNVKINGVLSKTSGTFEIDHPLDPKNKILRHSFVESPEMVNIYKGNVKTVGKKAKVTMPDWFIPLNGQDVEDYSFTITSLDGFCGDSYVNRSSLVVDGSFTVHTEKDCTFSWVVYGVRHDVFALAHPIEVESLKSDEGYVGGCYISPEEYGDKAKGKSCNLKMEDKAKAENAKKAGEKKLEL